MKNRKIIFISLSFISLLVVILAVIIFCSTSNVLKVVFFDIGQGDAILISGGSQQVLIDGGGDEKKLLEKMGKYVPFWDRNIEVVIVTHPDQDHIGGLIKLFKTYHIGKVVETNAKSDSQTFKKLKEEISGNGVEMLEAKKGLSINFPNNANAQIIYPANSLPKEVDVSSNDNSVVVKLSYGENKFLFTGDLPSTQESVLLNDNKDLDSQTLKVSHHGSKYATSNEFLDTVNPQTAIISVGKNNSYGHPSQEVQDRLIKHKIRILRTDEVGDIIYSCKNPESTCLIVN